MPAATLGKFDDRRAARRAALRRGVPRRQAALGRSAVIKVLRSASRRRRDPRSSASCARRGPASQLDHPYAARTSTRSAPSPTACCGSRWSSCAARRSTRCSRSAAPMPLERVRAAARADLRGRPHRARARHRPPRPQAGQRDGDRARRAALPKLLDFGIAKRATRRRAESPGARSPSGDDADRPRRDDRLAALHGARAVERPARRRRPRRHLRARRARVPLPAPAALPFHGATRAELARRAHSHVAPQPLGDRPAARSTRRSRARWPRRPTTRWPTRARRSRRRSARRPARRAAEAVPIFDAAIARGAGSRRRRSRSPMRSRASPRRRRRSRPTPRCAIWSRSPAGGSP